MAYATTGDYLSLYDSDMTLERLGAWLDRASGWLDVRMGGRLDASDAEQQAALQYVCIELVHRLDESPMAGMGIDSFSQGSNGFSETFSFANAAGGFNLLPSECKMLGLGSAIGRASVLGGDGDA